MTFPRTLSIYTKYTVETYFNLDEESYRELCDSYGLDADKLRIGFNRPYQYMLFVDLEHLGDEYKKEELMPDPMRCKEVEEKYGPFNCCTSCHEDEYYYGDDYMIEKYDDHGRLVAIVCCAGADKLDEEDIS